MTDSQLSLLTDSTVVSSELRSIADRAALFAKSGKSAATKRAYRSDFEHFSDWCVGHDLSPLPAAPEAVAFYITFMADADFACSTISRRLVAISQAHQLMGYETPTATAMVREVWKGIRREQGTAQESPRPLLTVEIRRIVQQLGDRLIDIRDRALLLVGFAGGLRRSELVGLHVKDIEDRERGIVLHIRRSKTDQEGQGQKVGVPRGTHPETCPVGALMEWLDVTGLKRGPLFRSITKGGDLADTGLSGYSVSLVVKRHVRGIGLNADQYSAHSLRSGFATEAARGGASEREIMRQTRHRSREVVRRYIKDGAIFRGNAAEKLGL